MDLQKTSYDIYVFDLDGTLLNTLEDLTLSVNAAMRFVGAKERTQEEVRSFVGNGIRLLIERALGTETADEKAFSNAFSYFKEYYGAHLCDHTAPYAGITQLLTRLKAAGKKTAVVSNKADFAVRELCRRYFGTLIDVAAGENEAAGIRKKPAPDAIFTAIERLGGGAAVYIGDSEVDIQTAQNAALPCISVCWGFKDET
ncbi:MAG: HAD family hydrolase, partial [Candidatus Scatosoma sp.]